MALRPTLSDGLPFSGLECFIYRMELVIGSTLTNFNETLANTPHETKAELRGSNRISVNQIRRNYGEKEWEEELYNFARDKVKTKQDQPESSEEDISFLMRQELSRSGLPD